MGKDDLDINSSDMIASVLKSQVGAIPFAGAFLTEVVGTLIPHQRLDRIVDYIRILDQRLDELPKEVLHVLKHNEEFIDLVEESFIQVSRSLTEERRNYILSIVTHGLEDKNRKFEESIYLLKILGELSDPEIITLKYHQLPKGPEKNKFHGKHFKLLYWGNAFISMNPDQASSQTIRHDYEYRLVRMGLIEKVLYYDDETGAPLYSLGIPRINYIKTTSVGDLLLKYIGISIY